MTETESSADGEYRVTDLSQSTEADEPSFKYVLEPSAFYSGDAVEREEERTGEELVVEDVSSIEDEAVQEAIETAIRTGHWRSNTLPDGLAATVERVDFFTGVSDDETHTHVGLTLYRFQPDQPPAVEFDAVVVDDVVSSGSPGMIELALRNGSQSTQQVFSGTVPPFGMVFANALEGDGEFILWRNYEEEGCFTFNDDGWMRCDIGIITKLEPCERISRRYEILPTDTSHQPDYTVPPGPGIYRISDSLGYYEQNGAPETSLSFEVEFTLESTG